MKPIRKKLISLFLALSAALSLPAADGLALEAEPARDGAEPVVVLFDGDPFEYTTLEGKREQLKLMEGYPDRFDLRDEGCVTSVKLQNPFGSCWGFAAVGAAETSILGSGLAEELGYDADTLDLSEKHLAYFASSYLDIADNPQYGEGTHHRGGMSASEILNLGGTPVLATNAFASGNGPVLEDASENYAYRGAAGRKDKRYFDGAYRNFSYSADDDWSLASDERFVQSFVLSESFMVPSPCQLDENDRYTYNPAGTAAIKEQLFAKRGVEIGFSTDASNPNQELGEDGTFLSTKNWAHYCWYPATPNHAVQIVGWDDNYPRDNFVEGRRPPEDLFPEGRREGATGGGNGAWLVKNSWGSGEEEFPNRGEGTWGLLKGQDKGVFNAETGRYEYLAGEDAPHTGYFWLSYYDQSIAMPEALSFDKCNQEQGYYLDQHDFMQVRFLSAPTAVGETKTANVFCAETCERLDEVSCQTTHPDTHVTYEIYLLADDFLGPEDGILVASMEEDYKYGGFHKKAIELTDGFGSERFLIQKGQSYSVVVTMRSADGTYSVSAPVGYADDGQSRNYDIGVINPNESFILMDGEWQDYSDEDVRNEVFVDPEVLQPAFDNFPIKGFATAISEEGRDLEITLTGGASFTVFRDKAYPLKLRFTGGADAELPEGAEITWSLTEGGEAFFDLEPDEANGRSSAALTPKAAGETYLLVTVDGVGTKVVHLYARRPVPNRVVVQKPEENGASKEWAYTGEPVEPELEVYAAGLDEALERGTEYTAEFTDNVRCGAALVSVTGAGETDPANAVSTRFPILPAKAVITALTAAPGQLIVSVQDQSESGITGYVAQYREAGGGEWRSKTFAADSTELAITGLDGGTLYEVRVSGYVEIPEEKTGEGLLSSYTGEPSEILTAEAASPLTAAVTADGSQLSYLVSGFTGGRLIAARFDGGRLTDVRTVPELSFDGEGRASGVLDMLGSGGSFRLFLVDGETAAPLCRAWSG